MPPCFSAGREQAKIAPGHSVHLQSPLCAPACGIWGQANTRQPGGELAAQAARVPEQGLGEPALWLTGAVPAVQGSVSSPPLSPASGDGGSQGASIQPWPCQSAQALGCPLLQTRRCLCAGEAAAPGGSGMGAAFASSSPLCCREPARAPCSSLLGLGAPSVAAGSPEQGAVPLPGHFTGCSGCSFACRVPGRASLPPLGGCRGHG